MAEEYARAALPGTVLPPADPSLGKPVFVTFGGGAPNYRRQVERIAEEARATGWFADILPLTDISDDPIAEMLRSELGDFLRRHPRGLGYWIWKPFVIARAFERFPDAPFILYADAGCELSQLGSDRFGQYLAHAHTADALFLQMPFPEREWCKAELREHPELAGADLDTGQYQATWLLFRNSPRARDLVTRWLELAMLDDGRLIVDPPAPEPGVTSHRHDQAILSLLAKSRGFAAIPWEDHFRRELYVPNSWVLLHPIHARRARKRRLVARIAALSSVESCRSNLAQPSPVFRAATAVMRRLIGWTDRLRALR